jgi:hypothetical protein
MLRSLLLGSAMLLSAQAASAAVITVNGAFTATDWTVYFGSPPAPIDPLYLEYSATFDTDLFYEDDASVLTLGATNIPYAIKFSWSPGGEVMVLATAGSSGGCGHPAFSFCAFVYDLGTGTPVFVEQSGSEGGWVAGTITAGGGPVIPEPATWAMMIAGFGLVGASLRRRRPATA